MDIRSISSSEYESQKKAFAERVKVDNSAVAKTFITVQWELVADLMRPYSRSDAPYSLGQKWYFGWDGADLRLAVSPLVLWPDQHRSGGSHVFEGGHHELIYDAAGRTYFNEIKDWFFRWRGSTSSYVDRYYAKATILRQSGASEPVRAGLDPCAAIVPWEDELVRLHEHNDIHKVPLDLVITHAAAEFTNADAGPSGYRHTLCFHMALNGEDLLDPSGEHRDFDYRSRAADLAQPCPPRCKKYLATT